MDKSENMTSFLVLLILFSYYVHIMFHIYSRMIVRKKKMRKKTINRLGLEQVRALQANQYAFTPPPPAALASSSAASWRSVNAGVLIIV